MLPPRRVEAALPRRIRTLFAFTFYFFQFISPSRPAPNAFASPSLHSANKCSTIRPASHYPCPTARPLTLANTKSRFVVDLVDSISSEPSGIVITSPGLAVATWPRACEEGLNWPTHLLPLGLVEVKSRRSELAALIESCKMLLTTAQQRAKPLFRQAE
ncbi:unnamed protein product [Protopolystoma xenopodis]|uniref:Uncharacterized protein n=1 Tax=Protopolystoma xenopodis TaxID=117903 RepID=A0A448WVJ4_9PLAT|nr:unnamed protein product [Protopolystoma xenopodis]